ncbi:MAG: GAF domain-containing protein [Rhodothermaceae bacterium]
MGNTSRIKKRLLIFILIPVLAVIPFLIEDIVVRITSAAILIIYVGFIIFLRDSIKDGIPVTDQETDEEEILPDEEQPLEEPPLEEAPTDDYPSYDTDDGEDFVIVSANKKVEVSSHSANLPGGRKNFFKPPDLKEAFQKIANEVIPENLNQDDQFGFILEKMLQIVKDSFLAHSAVFFWYNRSKSQLTLEKYISSSKDISRRKFDVEDDVLSKIAQNEEPEILSEISPTAESDVIRYYNTKQGIKSFVGVPLYYGKSLTAILAMDSKETDAFGIETIYSMGRFVRVLSILISIYDKKFEESHSELRLKALLGILASEKKFESEQELFLTLEQAVKGLLHWDAFTFVYFKPEEQVFKTAKIANKTTLKYVGENLEIDLNNSLVGKAILSGQVVKIDDSSENEIIRYSKSEDVSFDGSFLAIPMMYDGQYYGVICFESLKKNSYSGSDIKFIKNASKIFSFILYSFSTQKVLKNMLSVDIETNVLNLKTFSDRLYSDLLKAKELDVQGAIALIRIDDFIEQESLFDGDPFPKVLRAVARLINEEMPDIGLLGRLDEKIFGVYFFNVTTKDAFLWAEKLRVKIARQPIAVSTKQTTYTVSIGVASASNTTSIDKVLHNAELALNKALEKGGNSVKSIN